MANTLNNFGLAEKTLNTAGKWCTADIKVKIDSAELEKINSEYIRSGADIFGISGNYGKELQEVIIPAGIYEMINTEEIPQNCECTNIDFITNRGYSIKVDGFRANMDGEDPSMVYFFSQKNTDTYEYWTVEIGTSAANPYSDWYCDWVRYLVYVPNDVTTSASNAAAWYKLMHPYVSCLNHETKVVLSPDVLANYIINGGYPMYPSESECPNCGSGNYYEYEGEMRCDNCYYPYSEYCSDHGYYNGYYDSVCPSCYSYQCDYCDSRYRSEEELEDHKIEYHGYTRCDSCGHVYASDSGHNCSDYVEPEGCNHTYGDYGTSVYVDSYGEGNHTIRCRYCDYSTTESCSWDDDNKCYTCGQSAPNYSDSRGCNDCGEYTSSTCSNCGGYYCSSCMDSHASNCYTTDDDYTDGGDDSSNSGSPTTVCNRCSALYGTCSCEDNYGVCSWCGGEGCLCGQEN